MFNIKNKEGLNLIMAYTIFNKSAKNVIV